MDRLHLIIAFSVPYNVLSIIESFVDFMEKKKRGFISTKKYLVGNLFIFGEARL